jgi:PRC-barrel domain
MFAIAAAMGAVITPTRLLSQTTEIVKSDVDAVARGHRASELIGSHVENEKRETVGSIDDIVIGSNGYSFAVLQIGGFLGVGAQLVAVPCRSLKIGDRYRAARCHQGQAQELCGIQIPPVRRDRFCLRRG